MARRGPARLAFEASAVLCVVLAAAWWIFSRSVYGGPTELRAAVPTPAPAPVDDAVVEAVTGSVQRNSSQGAWDEGRGVGWSQASPSARTTRCVPARDRSPTCASAIAPA